MKNILIGGCSFSEHQYRNEHRRWTAWTDLLVHEYNPYTDYNITNVAHSSYGQSRIVESLTEKLVMNNFEYDFVIVQWSAVGRAYSTNERDFLNRLVKQNEVDFVVHVEEYISGYNGLVDGTVTSRFNQVSNEFYKHSLTQMFLLKSLLDFKNIKYKMFWGWQQLDDKIAEDNKFLVEKLYDENFIRFGNHGGMSEYLVESLGKDIAIIPGDFHPSTEGQTFFYNNIIKPIIEQL